MDRSTLLKRMPWTLGLVLMATLLAPAAGGTLPAVPSLPPGAPENAPAAVTVSAGGAPPAGLPAQDGAPRPAWVSAVYGQLPLPFEANRGQTDPRVRFFARSRGHTVFLTPTEAVLVFTRSESRKAAERLTPKGQAAARQRATGLVLRVTFPGASLEPQVTGSKELPGKANYFLGNDPAKWRTNVPTYAKVQYRALYPGIDLVWYGTRRHLEYDFIVAPGADPKRIVLGFEDADRLEVDTRGDLVLHTAAGAIRQRKPVIYQEVDGVRREISGGYVLKNSHQVGFQVAAYDASRPLIIDPVLFYSTYLGGTGFDFGQGIAVDAAGNAYVSGGTDSVDFPKTPGAFQPALSGSGDAFVTKLNPTGSGLIYSTYLGGSGGEGANAIAVDAAGNAYVTGSTGSADFPTLGAFQTTYGGGFIDAFVTKLNPTGSALLYSTYLGGSGSESGRRQIAVDAAGNAYVTGFTDSADFPTTPLAFQTALSGSGDAFVTKLNLTGSGLVYSTYLGGSADDQGSGLAVDAAGNAYVSGITDSINFPTTPGAFQPTFGGGSADAFVTKLNLTGSGLVYSTYLGGSGGDVAEGMALDALPNPNTYVSGGTDSADFPTTPGAFQPAFGGSADAFVTKLNPAGSGLVYSTYLGGSGGDNAERMALDALPTPNAYVTGSTDSTDFPTTPGAFQPALAGGFLDAFVAKITEAEVPPGPFTARVTGGGTIDVVGGIGTFSFIIQRASTGELSGRLQYVNHASGAKVQSQTYTSLVIVANTATFDGTCTMNGTPCTFTVNVTDNGEPGTTDTFTISVSGGPTEGGTLRSGNILIRQ